MKLNCGREPWNRWEQIRERIRCWHRWFAWMPVRVSDNECRWLEWVERRADCYETIRGVRTWYYRPAQRNKA